MSATHISNNEYAQLLKLNQKKIYKEIKRICKPIEDHFYTDAFFYSRLGKDGSYYHLGTRPDILEDYFYSGQLITSPTLSRLNYTKTPPIKIWRPVEENQEDLIPICQYFHRNNLDSGLTITIDRGDFREMFYFGTEEALGYACNHWFTTISSMYDFINYFSIEAKNIYQQAEDYKIEIPKLIGEAFFCDSKPKDLSFREQLFKTSFSAKDLTAREIDILQKCLRGKNVKQIADEASLSPRTVENNLLRIRQKYDCRSTHELVSLFVPQH